MTALTRRGVALLAGTAAFFFVNIWLGVAIRLIPLPDVVSGLLSLVGAVACAVLAFRYVGRSSAPAHDGEAPNMVGAVVTGALVVGGIGFLVGFLGPMILTPQANQGPLLGIFITGPLGVVLGAVGGYVRNLRQRTNT